MLLYLLVTLLVSLYGCMSGCLAIFHVGFGGHLGGRLFIKSVLHLIVVVACTGGLVAL